MLSQTFPMQNLPFSVVKLEILFLGNLDCFTSATLTQWNNLHISKVRCDRTGTSGFLHPSLHYTLTYFSFPFLLKFSNFTELDVVQHDITLDLAITLHCWKLH